MMVVSRYIAVCHPLHARSFINQRGTRFTILAVWLGSFVINLPRFWHYQPKTLPCHHLGLSVAVDSQCHCVYYQKLPGLLFRVSGFASTYTIIWATVAIFVPLVAMIVCNWCLVRALRRSSAMQQRCCRIPSTVSACRSLPNTDNFRLIFSRNTSVPTSLRTPTSAGHRLTPTLIALVVLFVVLVGPSEILTFAKNYVMTKQVIPYISNFLIALICCHGVVVVRALDSLIVRIPVVPLLCNDREQVVHTHVPLSPSSIIWYWPKGGDALRLGR